MTIQDVINLLVNNGLSLGITAYFLYRDYKFNDSLIKTLSALEQSVDKLYLKGK